MKLKFDSGLDYQLEAIKSVTDLFECLPEQQSTLSLTLSTVAGMRPFRIGILQAMNVAAFLCFNFLLKGNEKVMMR